MFQRLRTSTALPAPTGSMLHKLKVSAAKPASTSAVLSQDESHAFMNDTLAAWKQDLGALLSALETSETAWAAIFGSLTTLKTAANALFIRTDPLVCDIVPLISDPRSGDGSMRDVSRRVAASREELKGLLTRIEMAQKLQAARLIAAREVAYYQNKTQQLQASGKDVEKVSRNQGKSTDLAAKLKTTTAQLFDVVGSIDAERMDIADRAVAAMLHMQAAYFNSNPAALAAEKAEVASVGSRVVPRPSRIKWDEQYPPDLSKLSLSADHPQDSATSSYTQKPVGSPQDGPYLPEQPRPGPPSQQYQHQSPNTHPQAGQPARQCGGGVAAGPHVSSWQSPISSNTGLEEQGYGRNSDSSYSQQIHECQEPVMPTQGPFIPHPSNRTQSAFGASAAAPPRLSQDSQTSPQVSVPAPILPPHMHGSAGSSQGALYPPPPPFLSSSFIAKNCSQNVPLPTDSRRRPSLETIDSQIASVNGDSASLGNSQHTAPSSSSGPSPFIPATSQLPETAPSPMYPSRANAALPQRSRFGRQSASLDFGNAFDVAAVPPARPSLDGVTDHLPSGPTSHSWPTPQPPTVPPESQPIYPPFAFMSSVDNLSNELDTFPLEPSAPPAEDAAPDVGHYQFNAQAQPLSRVLHKPYPSPIG